jgi:hypothetical protein
MDPVSVALEEYRSLRAESLAAIDRQQRVVASGTATAGLILGLGASAPAGSTQAWVLLVLLEPLLAWLVTVVWHGEVERMVRAGSYVAMIEQRLNRELESSALGWETWLRREAPGGRRIVWFYRAVFGVLWIVALSAAILGTVGLAGHGTEVTVLAGVADGAALVLLLLYYVGSELRLRSLGGKRWDPDRAPRLLRWFGGGRAVAAGASPTEEMLIEPAPQRRDRRDA